MSDTFTMRLRAAVIAGWWTALIWWLLLLVVWVVWLALLNARPAWMLRFCGGGDLTWAHLQYIVLWAIGVFKLVMWVFVMVLIWLSLWVRRLKKISE